MLLILYRHTAYYYVVKVSEDNVQRIGSDELKTYIRKDFSGHESLSHSYCAKTEREAIGVIKKYHKVKEIKEYWDQVFEYQYFRRYFFETCVAKRLFLLQ